MATKNGLFNDLSNISNRTVLVRFSPLVYLSTLSTLSNKFLLKKTYPCEGTKGGWGKRKGGAWKVPL